MTNATRILITGGASGLGKALAERWAREAARVYIVDVNQERGTDTAAALAKTGAEVIFSKCDITQPAEVDAVRDRLLAEWQGVDIVVNNAGVASAGALHDESMQQWQWVFDINLFGAVRFTKAFTPLFRQQGRGYFLNVASQAGLTAMPAMGSYCAVKAALVSFSETMRLELAEDNIGVSVLCPAFFKTNLHESVRSGNPDMPDVVNKLLLRSTTTAEQVADAAYHAVQKGHFTIQTHAEGRRASRLRRWLPEWLYLKMMLAYTGKFRRKDRGNRNQL